MDILFSQEELSEIENIKSRYPNTQSALMPVLWLAQRKWGWISDDVIKYIAKLLVLPESTIEGVASFYTMFFKKKLGKNHIQVCTNVSCMLRDGDKIFDYISSKLGIGHNECTDDGKFSLEEVECMGACGGAPMLAINDDYYENIDIQHVDKLITESAIG
jgi:NADH-quinone oxidoreductase subunit E